MQLRESKVRRLSSQEKHCKVVSGRAITETFVAEKVKEHVSRQRKGKAVVQKSKKKATKGVKSGGKFCL